MTDGTELPETDPDEIASFWELARSRAGLGRLAVVTGTGVVASVPPPAWAFGDSLQLADELLALVLTGAKTATASAMWEYEEGDEALPAAGDLSIVLDGRGHPRALIRTTEVRVARFDEVDVEHARLEGEGDLSLDFWRTEHEKVLRRRMAESGREFSGDALMVLERFELRFPQVSAN
jgi:uncharacterized protein YhfF